MSNVQQREELHKRSHHQGAAADAYIRWWQSKSRRKETDRLREADGIL